MMLIYKNPVNILCLQAIKKKFSLAACLSASSNCVFMASHHLFTSNPWHFAFSIICSCESLEIWVLWTSCHNYLELWWELYLRNPFILYYLFFHYLFFFLVHKWVIINLLKLHWHSYWATLSIIYASFTQLNVQQFKSSKLMAVCLNAIQRMLDFSYYHKETRGWLTCTKSDIKHFQKTQLIEADGVKFTM